MKSLGSWLLIFFMAMFWVFRIVVTLTVQGGADSFGGFIVINNVFEIAMLFVSLLCFALIVRRMLIGGIIYLAGYGLYFGSYLISTAIPSLTSGETMDVIVLENVIIAVIALILGLCSILDIAIERTKAKNFTDKKTDWFYDNKKYERQLDERADKNQYKL